MSASYRVNEIFYSLQGEGKRAGDPSVFVRFSGCNLQCALATHGFDCDTEFVSGRTLAKAELLERIKAAGGPCSWVVLTGGEPSLQADRELVDALHGEGYKVAIESNGTRELGGLGLDWITVSPKVAEHALLVQQATEVKYVRHHGQGIPRPKISATHYLLSPAVGDPETTQRNLAWCIELCKAHPRWRLSVQQHKLWKVR